MTQAKKIPIQRATLAGKRRMVLSADNIAKLINKPVTDIISMVQHSSLRLGIEYTYDDKSNRYMLSLATAQTVLALQDTPIAWRAYHQITDFLQSGLKKTF